MMDAQEVGWLLLICGSVLACHGMVLLVTYDRIILAFVLWGIAAILDYYGLSLFSSLSAAVSSSLTASLVRP